MYTYIYIERKYTDNFENQPSCKGYSLCKMARLTQKFKNAKNMRLTILQQHYSCYVHKTARKSTKYSRNETILKIGHPANAIAFA